MQHDFILLDRSGSMSGLWSEAIGSINTYVKRLAEKNVDTGVTLALFDGDRNAMEFEILRDRITPATWKDVELTEAIPRGMTPLSDAVGEIVKRAEAGSYDKVAIIIMTDGHENASKELTVPQAKELLDRCRAKGWQVIFLGADFDNRAQAVLYGNKIESTLKVARASLVGAMSEMGSSRAAYATFGSSMEFSDKDKERFAK